MILGDTSVWISHFREKNPNLSGLLKEGRVACHPFIIGELACGNLINRAEILCLLEALPQATLAEHEEVLYFIEENRLMGKGLGLIDMHLLASAKLSEVRLWTLDNTLKNTARVLNLL